MKYISTFVLIGIFILFLATPATAQEKLMQDYSQIMEIPSITAMEASSAHLYILSEQDGMAVFRAYTDSLQWLYTSSGMQRRGNHIMADIRFAYLFGNSRRLTVLEPTSVLGVYSSTILPEKPAAAARIGNSMYLALGEEGLGKLSLNTPESVDSKVQKIADSQIGDAPVLDLKTTDFSKQLFVLTDTPELFVFSMKDTTLQLSRQISLRTPITHIFIDEEQVWGSTPGGEVYEIRSTGVGKRIGVTNEPIAQVLSWNGRLFIRTASGRVWVSDPSGLIGIWKDDPKAGNYLADSGDRLWIAENNKVTEVKMDSNPTTSAGEISNTFKIKPIPNQIITYPNPLILALEMEGNSSPAGVEFSYRSNARNAKIRKQGFYWQPTVNQVGIHRFNIVATNADGATDSTRFVVDVRSFNSPPRFSPVRSASIAINENYTINFNATDPENPSNSLVRYIGVDLPDGASINEKTGAFNWTPTERQVGRTTFRIIATDRLGAASSMDVTLTVLDISRSRDDS
jgi:hypothetical protein